MKGSISITQDLSLDEIRIMYENSTTREGKIIMGLLDEISRLNNMRISEMISKKAQKEPPVVLKSSSTLLEFGGQTL